MPSANDWLTNLGSGPDLVLRSGGSIALGPTFPVSGDVIVQSITTTTSSPGLVSTPALPTTFETWVYSFWVSSSASGWSVLGANGQNINFQYTTGQFNAGGSGLTNGIVPFSPSPGSFHHLILSVDTVSEILQAAVDGTIVAPTTATFSGSPESGSPGVLSNWFGPFNAEVGEVFFTPTASFFDLTVPANLAKFIDAEGNPVWLGADGSLPLGVVPVFYYTLNSGAPVAQYFFDGETLTAAVMNPLVPAVGSVLGSMISGGTVVPLSLALDDTFAVNSGTISVAAGAPPAADLIGGDGTIFRSVTVGSGLDFTDDTLSATGGAGTVTNITAGSNITINGASGGTLTATGVIALQNSPTISVTSVSAPLFVNAGTAALAGTIAGGAIILQNDGTASAGIVTVNVGVNAPYRFYVAKGAFGTLTAVTSGMGFGGIQGFPYDGATFNQTAGILASAIENHTTAAHGSRWTFSTVHQGSTVSSNDMILTNGALLVGTTAAVGSELLNINGGIVLAGPLTDSSLANALTAAGSTQGGALTLTADVNIFSSVPAGAGAQLATTPGIGRRQQIINGTTNTLLIYPAGSDQINNGTTGAAATIAAGSSIAPAGATAIRNAASNWVMI